MKRNKKLTIFALSAMLVMTLAVTVITFSFADNNDNGTAISSGTPTTVASGAALTNIDYIIKGTADEDSEPYKIVEIGSAPVATEDGATEPYTDFGIFAEKGGFKDYVINGNRTIADEMADGKIDYKYFYVGDVTDDNEAALAAISGADFVYVSQNKDKPYSNDNDMGEALYNILHVCAVGDYKPFVIDSPADSGSTNVDGGGSGGTAGNTFDTLVKDYYAKTGYLYNAFSWNTGLDANQYYSGQGTSLFISISGRAKMSGWTTVSDQANASEFDQMAEILYVTKTGTTDFGGDRFDVALQNRVEATLNDYTDPENIVSVATEANQKIFNIEATELYLNGYSNKYVNYKPEYVLATEVSLDALKADATFDFSKYDLVIFEDDLAGVAISDNDFYKRLIALMRGKTHLIFSDKYGTTTTDTPDNKEEIETSNDTNYKELYFMVATENGVERYVNAMITTKMDLDIIMSSNNAATCKEIADLINASSFRGIGGPGQTSSLFTVLEIQPCYPIDMTLATTNKKYYTIPSDVINGKTREQLGIKHNADGTSVVDDATPEYYAWELSEAMIADALDMDVKQVKVVHMSSEEFATSKDAVLGNYDMVYIGGNTSALKSIDERPGLVAMHGDYRVSYLGSSVKYMPVYTMYAHTGDMVRNKLDVQEGPVTGGTLKTSIDGYPSNQIFVTLNGNDISYNALMELEKFVDAGMPVIFGSDVYNAYYDIKVAKDNGDNPYLQNDIDPDSYMCKFLDYCADINKKSVTWNINVNDTMYSDNDGGRLGDTLTGEVEILNNVVLANETKSTQEKFKDAYDRNNKRPKLAVTSMPPVYNVYDPSTKTTSLTLAYEFDVTGSTDYTVNLYADYDKNSIFIADEIIASASSVTEISANLANVAKYGATHSGPVYWKLEIVDNNSQAAVSTSNLAYVQQSDAGRKQIRVLQILPEEGTQVYEGNGWVSLIFCTECQRAIQILDRNPGYSDGNIYDGGFANLYDGKIGDNVLDSDGSFNGIYTGKHEHRFGVVRYDSAIGADDWHYNYADDVSDMFDIDIDIMTSRDFEAADKDVKAYMSTYLANNFEGKAVANMTDTEKETLKANLLNDALAKKDLYDTYVTLDDIIESTYPGRTYKELTTAEFNAMEASLKAAYDAETARIAKEDGTNPSTMINNYALAYAEYQLLDYVITVKGTSHQVFTDIYNTRMYSDYIIALPDTYSDDQWHYADYKKYYEAYAKALDVKIDLKAEYDKYNRYANYDNWLLGCYESIIIGPAESFCGDDIEDAGALATLEGYVKGDGHMLLFHDTLSAFSDTGAHKLTDVLIDYFGMDKNHVEVDTATVNSNPTITETVSQIRWTTNNKDEKKSTEIYINGTRYGNINMSLYAESMTFNNVKIGDQNSGNNFVQGPTTLDEGQEIKFIFKDMKGTDNNLFTGTIQFKFADDAEYRDVTVTNGYAEVMVPNYTVKEVTTAYTSADLWYLPYKLKTGYSSDKYILPNLSTRVPSSETDVSKFFGWRADMLKLLGMCKGGNISAAESGIQAKYYSPLYAYSDSLVLSHNDNTTSSPYRYATVAWKQCTQNGYAASVTALGSNKASKTNDGITTMFPFSLSDELNIAPTHAQAYAIDLNNEKLSVWYTIGGGNNNKAGSEIQAATPHDGTDNYFIYTIGNLNYCGAGHTKVTGQGKDNNDERMLYINIICNSVTNVPVTEIKAFDYDSTDAAKTNNIVKKNGSEYIYKIDETITRPGFSFEYNLASGATLSDIKVYYELDNVLGFGSTDVLIKQYTSSDAQSGKLIYVPKSTTDTTASDYINLELKPEYLTNGRYVYIVIQVTDTDGNKSYKKIKVEYKDKLYNLT